MKNLYKVTCYTPYVGTDVDYWVFADNEADIPEETLNEWMYENAGSYEYLIAGWGEESNEEEREDYYAECGYDISGPYTLEDAVDEGFCGTVDDEY